MAGATAAAPMDIDAPPAFKGKGPLPASAVKSSPWVEKYRPQSLADVAAHRDIVDTSKCPAAPFNSGHRLFAYSTALLSWLTRRRVSVFAGAIMIPYLEHWSCGRPVGWFYRMRVRFGLMAHGFGEIVTPYGFTDEILLLHMVGDLGFSTIAASHLIFI
jgi:hypothetical protein